MPLSRVSPLSIYGVLLHGSGSGHRENGSGGSGGGESGVREIVAEETDNVTDADGASEACVIEGCTLSQL